MAWAEQLPGGNWRGFWRDASGTRRSASTDKGNGRPFATKEAARRYAIGREAVARDNGPQNTGKGLTWGQWQDRWLELRRVEPATAKQDAYRITKHLAPQWSGTRLARIQRQHVQAWVNDLADDPTLSAATVARIYHLFSASMRAAVKAGQLPASPCQLIDLPTPPPATSHHFTKAEVQHLLDHVTDQTAADLILVLAYTGLRFGELAGLHWDRIDLSAGTLTVIETWDAAAKQVKPYPKSKKPRTVPLTPNVLQVLTSRPPDTGGCGQPHAKGSACRSSLVIGNKAGRPVDYSWLRNRQWTPALELAGLGPARLHDLRHSYASWLAQDGLPIHVIRQMLGHATVTTTERYSHIGSEQYTRVLEALGGGTGDA